MNYNPYAAPQAAPPPPGGFGPSAGGPQAWDVGEVLSTAFEAFKNNWAVLVGSFFVFGALLLPLGGLPYVLTYTHTLDKGLASGHALSKRLVSQTSSCSRSCAWEWCGYSSPSRADSGPRLGISSAARATSSRCSWSCSSRP